MSVLLKKSKFNFHINDCNGDIILFNFLTGIKSLARILKDNVDVFTEHILNKENIFGVTAKEHNNALDQLYNIGFLVDSDIDEDVLYRSIQFEEIFDNVLRLTVFPTGKCNFRCPYCFETHQSFCREVMSSESQNELLRFVQKSIPNYKALHISWFGGEPLLSPDVIVYLSNGFKNICKSRHISYSADIISNGYLLDANMFSTLYNLGVYHYYITLDGSKEQHDKLRVTNKGGGTFDRIISNLMHIKKSKQFKFAKITIRVNMSVGFFDYVEEFIDYLTDNFSEDLRFDFSFVPVVKFSGSTFSDKAIIHDYSQAFERLYNNKKYVENLLPKELRLSSIIRQPKCPSSLKNSYVITPDLKIYKCNAHYDFEANQLGKIAERGNLIINEALHKKWYLTRTYTQKMPSDCENCCYSPCCVFVDSSCPVSFLKQASEEYPCFFKDKKLKNEIKKTILYASKNYPCTTIEF